jgi:predicted nucleic acid-binding protein
VDTAVVPDASIFIASAISQPFTIKAQLLIQEWLRHKTKLVAPILIQYEIVSVIRKHVRLNQITSSEATRIRDHLLSRPIQLYFDEGLVRRAYELATIHNQPTAYDARYLALAGRLACDFWTVDERLYNAVHDKLPWVNWLGDFQNP